MDIQDPDIEIISQPDNTLEIRAALEDFTITIHDPEEFAGTYSVKLEDIVASKLYGDPIVLTEGLSLIIP